ncbi:hypothetical protein OLMES_5504 [Oleiphilus messinensis]|uniref:DUF3325 domain-containing protein n=1 Tax=Oleiphilus messinensis TaxID=141451 RepID=A0A1Y0IJC0_9GAMM|nr:DUF3325 domain-containing protein [Oleiphilus messinensis]ARU59484.1 hypothetical protein OLMES_5504 [Oleiphilus messinensis]
MSEVFWLLFAIVFSLTSMAWFALSINSHWKQVFGNTCSNAHALRIRSVGMGLLLLSAICCFKADHPTMAILVWIMLIPTSAILVALMLSKKPKLMQFFYPFSAVNLARSDNGTH